MSGDKVPKGILGGPVAAAKAIKGAPVHVSEPCQNMPAHLRRAPKAKTEQK
jgi:hypothetical protein